MSALYTVEWLAEDVRRRVAFWRDGEATIQQTTTGIRAESILTLADHPTEGVAVASIVSGIPQPILKGIAERLTRLPTTDGRWDWPPEGILMDYYPEKADPSGCISWRIPSPEEQAAIHDLRSRLRLEA